MNTPLLIDVPSNRPKRDRSSRSLLMKFKAEHGIETYHTKSIKREEYPWVACHMPAARRIGKAHGLPDDASMIDLIAHLSRLLEETGAIIEGRTEREAVQRLCNEQKITFTL